MNPLLRGSDMGFHLSRHCMISDIPASRMVDMLRIGEALPVPECDDASRQVMEAALEVDLLERHPRFGYIRTDLGFALSKAHFTPRVALGDADQAFALLLSRIATLERATDIRIPSIWIYGSYMRRAPMVGDIDLCLDWRFVSPACADDTLALATSELRACDHPRSEAPRDTRMQAWIKERIGLADHPMFRDLSLDMTDLRAACIPCREISREGYNLLYGAILPHHPRLMPSVRTESTAPDVPRSIETGHGHFRSGRMPDWMLETSLALTLRESVMRSGGDILTPLTGPELGTLYRDLEMHFGHEQREDSALRHAWEHVVRPLSATVDRNDGHAFHHDEITVLLSAVQPVNEPEALEW